MKILAPTECPSCGSQLERVTDQLFCRNSDDCPAQSTKRLQNFCKKLKIKGFGEATLEKLGLRYPNDLLYLRPEAAMKKGFSEHMAEKLVNTINDRLSQGISPNDFLAAMSIPMIGDGAMRKLSFDKIGNITYEMCRDAGIGDKAATSLVDWIDQEWENLLPHWEIYFTETKQITKSQTPSKGITVCITGKLDDFKNRNEATAYLTSLGYEVKSSVTKAVQYLICEDETKTGSSSYKKALDNNIKITTIKSLLEDTK